jgi:hypothetical protein
MCLPYSALAALLAGCLSISFGLCSIKPDKIEPTGTNIGGAIQFDAIIELNRYSPDSLRQDYTMIFARYWVTRDYYNAAIVWAEPQSTDLFFAIHPPTLSFASNEQGFKVSHELKTKYNETFKKPLGERGVFRYKFGSYPIGDIRFAEQEALAERIYTTDLRGLEDANQTFGDMMDLSIQLPEGGAKRYVSQLKVQTNGERIDSLQLFNADEQLIKDISYEYENIGGMNCLRKLTAVLPERPIMVSFKGEGIKVTLDGKKYQYRDLEATHHVSGRICTVEYEFMQLGDKEVNLPVKVTVRNQKDGRILRCARMMNFELVDLDAAGAEEAARQFVTFNADRLKYQELREKYWKKVPTEIENKDVEAIERLRDRFEKTMDEAGKNTGEKLKYLNALIELNRIVGNELEMERHYQNYLSTLSDSNLLQMILVGGYGVIETSIFRQRLSEAEKLLDLWVKSALEINDEELILSFAKSQLSKNRLWTTVKLLEGFSNKKQCSDYIRFEVQVLRCIALGELCKLVHCDNITNKGFMAEIQANWVVSIGKDNLDTMLTVSIDQARRFFAELSDPTDYQQALKKQINKIDKEINQEKTSTPK